MHATITTTALALLGCAAVVSCSAAGSEPSYEAAADAGASDSPLDVSTEGAALMDAPVDPKGSEGCPGLVQSFIWVANTGEGTLSKVCTVNGEEVARYYTSPQMAGGDPSRTSVNLYGDMVVTNRDPQPGPSSVTKFASSMNDCLDRNHNGEIDTSLGPDDVRPWGEDECMLWNTPLGGGGSVGARATAWDGKEDRETGKGGSIYIGALTNRTIYKLNGDTGAIEAQAVTAIGHYGGAIDGRGNFWTVAMGCTIGQCQIERISVDNLNDHQTFPVHCGYGISIDFKGRVWSAGQNIFEGGGCVSRLDPVTGANDWVTTGAADFNRGVAVGLKLSQGSVWAASTNGDLIQVDMETLQIVRRQKVGVESMVGVAIDYEGNVWTVSEGGNAAHKVNPTSWEITTVPLGLEPYTYSDMTGMQLLGVVDTPK